jgi:gamma-glutamyltranspeptidase/glutathione hydrolase
MKSALLVTFAGILAVQCERPATAQRPQQPDRLVQFPARGTRGAIAGGSNYATEAGMRMYYSGGNAVDAGVATIFAAATTEYERVGWAAKRQF